MENYTDKINRLKAILTAKSINEPTTTAQFMAASDLTKVQARYALKRAHNYGFLNSENGVYYRAASLPEIEEQEIRRQIKCLMILKNPTGSKVSTELMQGHTVVGVAWALSLPYSQIFNIVKAGVECGLFEKISLEGKSGYSVTNEAKKVFWK